MTETYPTLVQTVLDTTDPRGLAEFYRELLGLVYRPGDEPPAPGQDDQLGRDWLCLRTPDGRPLLAFQAADEVRPSTWPDPDVPQQLHLDLTVADEAELVRHRDRALALGATLRLDRSDDPEEPLFVLADPAGHPFCLYVG